MGRSRPARGPARLRTPLPQRLMELLPGVDVRIVADRATEGPWRNSNERPNAATWQVRPERSAAKPDRILLPFTNLAISRRAFEAAIRLANAEGSTIVPAFLARVPRNLPIDSALPAACSVGMPLLEAIEQQASAAGHPRRLESQPGTHLPRRAASACSMRSTSIA